MDNAHLYSFLDEHKIAYERHDHPPVFTCEEADQLVPCLPAAKTKNLFLCDDKGRTHFLVTMPDAKSVDLKALAGVLDIKKLRFASAKRLEKHLKIIPGAVTLLATINDDQGNVRVVLDREIDTSDAVLCHPLVNTSTLLISMDDLRRFLTTTGHEPEVIDIPQKKE
ncbi:MAG: prolyl-tRNA synthetase associated domain-containing protein [Desulfobacteraceae bacterium]|nr:prolyl-tRNA synthetase associated domain-containing protein [Desulfobacteraceae bacterium]